MRGVSKDRLRRACGHPSRLVQEGEHLRMTAVLLVAACVFGRGKPGHDGGWVSITDVIDAF